MTGNKEAISDRADPGAGHPRRLRLQVTGRRYFGNPT